MMALYEFLFCLFGSGVALFNGWLLVKVARFDRDERRRLAR